MNLSIYLFNFLLVTETKFIPLFELDSYVLLIWPSNFIELSLVHYINIHINYNPLKQRILFDFSNCPSPSCANFREIEKRNPSHCSWQKILEKLYIFDSDSFSVPWMSLIEFTIPNLSLIYVCNHKSLKLALKTCFWVKITS